MGRYYSGDIEGKFWFGVQSSDDANYFGGVEVEVEDEESEEVMSMEYFFEKEDLEDINAGIKECLDGLGEAKQKIDGYFETRSGYNDITMSEELGISVEKLRDNLTLYARLRLGNQIKECVEKRGKCYFTADLY
jgi:hypothetical protein